MSFADRNDISVGKINSIWKCLQIHHRALYVLCGVCMCKMCPKAQKAEKELNRQKICLPIKGHLSSASSPCHRALPALRSGTATCFLLDWSLRQEERGWNWSSRPLGPWASAPLQGDTQRLSDTSVPVVPLPSLTHCSLQECLRPRAGSLFYRWVPVTPLAALGLPRSVFGISTSI